jgi:phospholipase C
VKALDLIDTIAIVMLENRSFDHILGHLSLKRSGYASDVEGLKDPLECDEYENSASGEPYYPVRMRDGQLSTDLPHERAQVAVALAWNAGAGKFAMDGFVKAYFQAQSVDRSAKPGPMGVLGSIDLPITRFFADEFAVCDHWFACLPTSTQPNRLMALTGATRIDQSGGPFPTHEPLLTDWLQDRGVRWRVYHSGISFFALLGKIEIFGSGFRHIDRLAPDVNGERPHDFPSVIIVEPSYNDGPHLGNDVPNCNHPPYPVGPGEAFLRQVYQALTCNPARWSRTLMVVTYDESGGFYDHVPPPAIPYVPGVNASFKTPFGSLGPRVPALVISPLVSQGRVYKGLLDHTSILQLLAEKFGTKSGYSPRVEARRNAGIGSVSAVLDLLAPRQVIPAAPTAPPRVITKFAAPSEPSPMQAAFAETARWMVNKYPRETAQQYPGVSHWVIAETEKHA